MSLARLGVVASCLAFSACGSPRVPPALRGYDLLVERRDALGAELARALREQGFRVRRAVRGGGRPTAAVVLFTFRPGPAEPTWLHLRLADTRTGLVLAAASLPTDSAGPTAAAQADAAVRALAQAPTPP